MDPITYLDLKFLHELGVTLLLGNVTVTSVWKVFADRTRSAQTIAFAQRLVTGTDWFFTLSGIALIVGGGYGMAWMGDMPLTEPSWLVWSQGLFFLSGTIWVVVLLPLQIKQARLAATFRLSNTIPELYWKLSRAWLWWGIVATVPLVDAMYFMVTKP